MSGQNWEFRAAPLPLKLLSCFRFTNVTILRMAGIVYGENSEFIESADVVCGRFYPAGSGGGGDSRAKWAADTLRLECRNGWPRVIVGSEARRVRDALIVAGVAIYVKPSSL